VPDDSGESTDGTIPDPTNHTFLDLSCGGSNRVSFGPGTVFEIDGTGTGFAEGQRYSYAIGLVVAAAELSSGPLNVRDPARFRAVGFQALEFSPTSDGTGVIYPNFTPVPEPGFVLATAAAGCVLLPLARRRETATVSDACPPVSRGYSPSGCGPRQSTAY
jgi:hypothetical protein